MDGPDPRPTLHGLTNYDIVLSVVRWSVFVIKLLIRALALCFESFQHLRFGNRVGYDLGMPKYIICRRHAYTYIHSF